MPFKDILLHLESYPDRVTDRAIDGATALAAVLGQDVTAVSPHVGIPLKTNRLADFALRLGDLARTEEARGAEQAESALDRFEVQAKLLNAYGGRLHPKLEVFEAGEHLAMLARTRDLCVVPASPQNGVYQGVAEAVLFGSGRPVVVAPENAALEPRLDTVVLAWDGGAPAAAAVGAAMPLLRDAKAVKVLVVLNEKAGIDAHLADDLMRHLGAHGVAAEAMPFDAAGATIGSVFRHVTERVRPDLLVMGAFGHSRARQFVLGGATRAVLESPPAPVLLAR